MNALPNLLRYSLVALLSVSAARAAESIFPDTVTPGGRPSDAPNWELGTVFRPSLPGRITQVRVFSLTEEIGDHQVRIWRNADNSLTAGPISWTYGGDEAWITLDIPDVAVAADQEYTVAISTTADGYYPANGSYFLSAGNNGQNVEYPQGAGVFSSAAGVRPTDSFNNAAYLRDIVFETDLSGTVMKVKGNNFGIADGSTVATSANGTDVGSRGLDSGTREQIFTIQNLGQTPLQLTGNPLVAVSGAQATDFVITTQPSATVPGGGSAAFTVRFDPSAIGVRKAILTIPHADSAANPYDFAIQGTGLSGGAGVIGNDGVGAFARNIDATQIHGNRFVAPVDMRITELRAKVLALEGIFKCAVYADNNGLADRLLQSSVEVVNATNGWNAFPLVAPINLTGGDYYWLVIWADTSGARVQADIVGTYSSGSYAYSDLAGQWPDPITLTQAPGDAAVRTYCIYAEGTPLSVTPGPEFDLRGNGKLIVTGDGTPSVLDGTDFGNIGVGGFFQDQTFTIQNPGTTALNLSGSPRITVTGLAAADFVVTSAPNSPVPAGSNATFVVRFDPSATGVRAATISVANDDADENPFQFAVQGAGFIAGRETIFADSKTGRDIDFDGAYYELGTRFQSSTPGRITHLRVYALATESGDHTARVWRNSDETVIGGPYTWNYGGTNGWIELDIPDLEIDADVEYTVSVSTGSSPKRNYPNVAADLVVAGGNNQHLSYPVNAGVFTETKDGRPTGSFNGGNYLRDVVFVPIGPESIFADTKTGRDIDFDGAYYELGTRFQSSVAGTITHLRVYALASETGDHTARIWRNSDETVVGGPYTWTYGGTTGWIQLDIPDVSIEANVEYTVSVSTGTSPKRNYPNVAADLVVAGGNGQHLSYPVNAGVFGETKDARPTGSFNGGNYLRDVVFLPAGATEPSTPLRIIEIKSDSTSGNVTLRWEGDGPVFQVEKSTAVTGPFQSIGSAQSERAFTDPGALKSGVRSFYRIRQGSGGATPQCVTTPAINTWVNTPFANQTGTFTATFDVTPSQGAPLDAVIALSADAKTAFGDFACLVRFNTNGTIDARNGDVYESASNIEFAGGVKYAFRLAVNVPVKTYSVFVTPTGGTEQTVGSDFAFRPTAGDVKNLNNWAAVDDTEGSVTVCNFQVLP